MNKQMADGIITDYLQKIYGFAVKKSFTYEEAEDLSAEIVKNVYSSLLKMDEIHNIEGYIWRISEFTYSRYVSQKKKYEGVSIDEMQIPYYEEYKLDEDNEELLILRGEIAYLTECRRKIIFMFYYQNKPIAQIAKTLNMPEGTVKWHLNKARNELKEGYKMERKIGKLGINPVEMIDCGHSGNPGNGGGPENYLNDSLNLNIVYSVYNQPKNKKEIAEELGLTPVYIEDKIKMLEANGYLVQTDDKKFTTYVKFTPLTYSAEFSDIITKKQLEIAQMLVEEYVPSVRETLKNHTEKVYIPGGNFELFEAAAIFRAINSKCHLETNYDLSKYYIKTTHGGDYIAFVTLKSEKSDKDYVSRFDLSKYGACGNMWRDSEKYPISSWSIDSRYCSRKGGWKNNLYTDYEYLYEFFTRNIEDNIANSEKLSRLRDRKYLDENDNPNIMIFNGCEAEFLDLLPQLNAKVKKELTKFALDIATQNSKNYPEQMRDLSISWDVGGFVGNTVAIMVMDILYGNGTFKSLTENEKVTSQLIMFSDVLPK